MDSSRRSSSRQDTTRRSLQDASTRSRPLDLSRPSHSGYDRAYSTHDAAGGSPSGYDRAHSTRDVEQSSAGNAERQTDDATGQGGSPGGYDRAYSTYDTTPETFNQRISYANSLRDQRLEQSTSDDSRWITKITHHWTVSSAVQEYTGMPTERISRKYAEYISRMDPASATPERVSQLIEAHDAINQETLRQSLIRRSTQWRQRQSS